MDKAFDPKQADANWYSFWEEGNYFTADSASAKPAYTISIPPPNVTGVLHMGHALVNTLQDILIRYKRMDGFEALWMPGTDHAGIATQTLVERHLMAREGKRRADYPREEFLAHVWEWKEKSEAQILGQLKRLGCSCDWSRTCFTMDERNNRAVRTIFKRLYDQGLIYRGDYLVNWDPVTQTALADDEVEYEEQPGSLWHIQYGPLVVATTRPETMLGDTAVAVHPEDPRYKKLIGTTIRLPLSNRDIPIIGDHRVDPAFGTGAVKVTPAHDINDYEMALTHHLPMINIMTPDGKICLEGPYKGLSMAEARAAVVKDLGSFLVKTDPHTKRVGVSYRSKAVIEPYLSKQWFVKMSGFAQKMRAAVAEGRCKLLPKSFENTYYHWIDNLRDWCISRQLWWGHRIPIWYGPEGKIFCSDSLEDPQLGAEWRQDEDVLDTWFSSALWPFATLGWPEKTPDFTKFYPNSVLVTGHDILFFWVARMLMMGEYATGQLPFPETFLHGLIFGKSYWRMKGSALAYVSAVERDAYEMGKPTPSDVQHKWEKMSKSKGNVIDPIEMIDKFGADAVRMALAASATQGRQIDLDRRRFEEYKNFANKIWNATRFVLMNVASKPTWTPPSALEDLWILSRLNETISAVRKHLDNYEFDKYIQCCYDFFWNDFCAIYVEVSKKQKKEAILLHVLTSFLKLLHPVAPFITEELFHVMKKAGLIEGEAMIIATFPQTAAYTNVDEEFGRLQAIVSQIRTIRAEMALAPAIKTAVQISYPDPAFLEKHLHILTGQLPCTFTLTQGKEAITVALPPELLEREKQRVVKEIEKLQSQLATLETQLSNPDFLAKAPSALVDKLSKQKQELQQALLTAQTKAVD